MLQEVQGTGERDAVERDTRLGFCVGGFRGLNRASCAIPD